jgi:hypothetical protein
LGWDQEWLGLFVEEVFNRTEFEMRFGAAQFSKHFSLAFAKTNNNVYVHVHKHLSLPA